MVSVAHRPKNRTPEPTGGRRGEAICISMVARLRYGCTIAGSPFPTMNTDNPETVSMDEPTRWAETVADDVFQPTVKVQLHWSDIEAAVEQGAVLPQHAHALWAGWAMPGSPTRVNQAAIESRESSFPAALSDPPYLEKLRQLRSQPLPEPAAAVPAWLAHVVTGCIGALIMFFLLAFF